MNYHSTPPQLCMSTRVPVGRFISLYSRFSKRSDLEVDDGFDNGKRQHVPPLTRRPLFTNFGVVRLRWEILKTWVSLLTFMNFKSRDTYKD